MNACELTATITALANGIACKLSDDELAALSTVLVQLGDTLATIATHRTLCNNNLQKKNAVKNPKV
jgi:hypothetical protein